MKSFKIFLLVLAIFALIFSVSCKKDHTDETVTIEIEEPTEGMMVMSGDSLHMHIHFSSPETIHNVSVKVYNESNSDEVVYNFEEHVHADGEYLFHEHMVPMVTDHSDFRLEAQASGHEDGAFIYSETVHFQVHPQ